MGWRVQGATSVMAYFNNTDTFYSPSTGEAVESGWVKLDAPLNTIPFHIRHGTIIPIKNPAITTEKQYATLP